MLAGILLVVLPSVMYGGLSLLTLLTTSSPGYTDDPVRHDLWRAGHAHAGVYLLLSLVMLRYVDEAELSPFWKWIARTGAPIAAILIPAAFILSVAAPTAKEPNWIMNIAYIRAAFLAAAVLTLGVGLIRAKRHGKNEALGRRDTTARLTPANRAFEPPSEPARRTGFRARSLSAGAVFLSLIGCSFGVCGRVSF
jgi:drug/metabolite transporter superfamily protein YnfA